MLENITLIWSCFDTIPVETRRDDETRRDGTENRANSVQLLLQLPIGTELGNSFAVETAWMNVWLYIQWVYVEMEQNSRGFTDIEIH